MIGKLAKGLDECATGGGTAINMKRDWRKILTFG